MQRTEPFADILNKTINERLGKDYMTELTGDELVQELILGENEDTNLYSGFCSFMEKTLVPAGDGDSNLIFAPTTKALRFYRSYFRKQLTDVLFVGVDDPSDPEAIISKFSTPPKSEGSKDDAFGETNT